MNKQLVGRGLTPLVELCVERAGRRRVVASRWIGVGCALFVLAAGPVFGQQILQNGSFESDYAGWTPSGNQVVVSGEYWVATDGLKAVVFNVGQLTPNGLLSQTFTTTPGQTYTLAFDVGAISGVSTYEQRLQVTLQGASPLLLQTVSVFAPGNGTSYVARSFTFVADSATTTLTFQDTSPTTINVDLMLDNVRVTENALVNGSFENGYASWTASGNQAIFTNDPNHPASQGSKVVVFNPDDTIVNAVLSQTFATTPGQRYGLAFDLGTVGAIADQRVRVRVQGALVLLDQTLVFAGINAGPFYIPQHLSFVADSTSATLTFTDVSITYYVVDALVDDIQVPAENPQAPLVTSQPQRAGVAQGGNATFSVVASGTGPLTYQWQFNGSNIPGATSNSYTVTGAEAGKAGNYRVRVTNAAGSVNSSAATLTVLPPAILLNGSFEYGSAAWTFSNTSVSVSTNTSYGVTDGVQLVHFNFGEQEPNGVLSQSFGTTPGQEYVLTFDAGAYSNGNQNQQRMQVTVQGQGPSPLLSQSISVFPPGTGGAYVPQTFTFVADSSMTTLRFQDTSPTTSSVDLLLDNVRVALQGSAPVIIAQPQSATVAAGSPASFSVTATGPAPLFYQWRFNGTPIGGATAGSYTIASAQAADAGNYDVVVSNAFGSVTSAVATLTVLAVGGLPNGSLESDFDGDGKADVVVFRPSDGGWWVFSSLYNVGYRLAGWGAPGDIPFVADLDGDGQPDLIAYRPSTGYWLVLYSSHGYSTAWSRSFQWGAAGDIPLLADFDGDGRPDLTIYRPSTGHWFVWFSSTGFVPGGWTSFPWGAAGDQPLAGDFDGDGKADLAVFRPSTGQWFVAFSSFSYSPSLFRAWGTAGDQPIAGDFDGDGRTDLTVFRPSTGVWFIWFSSGDYVSGNWGSFPWGQPGDQPAVQDFDGDGRTDIAIWRPSTGEWFILTSSSSFTSSLYRPWGAPGDIPLASPLASGAPVMAAQPQSASVAAGSPVGFSVTATGTAPISYQWRFNGIPLGGATASTYTIASAQAANAGNYNVVVSNSVGSVTSAVATLTVQSVPSGGFTNGSFESDLAGWTATGNLGVVSGSYWVATNGLKAVVFNGGETPPNGVLSQSFPTTAGQAYTLAFDVGAISGVSNYEQRLQVTVQGASPLLSQTASVFAPGNGTSYVARSFTFTADSAATTLTFRDTSLSTINVDLMLDNVRVGALPPLSPLTATSAIVIDRATGVVLGEKNPDSRQAMGSTTKIMTALLAIELNGSSLDTIVGPISAYAGTMGGSTMNLNQGDHVSLRDLLYGLMLPSGNDAAIAIAEHVAGTEAQFVALMNQRAQQLGLVNTAYRNAPGWDPAEIGMSCGPPYSSLPNCGHYSTARDLVTLARFAMNQPLVAQIVSTVTWTPTTWIDSSGNPRTLSLNNDNLLLSSMPYPGANGVKTGMTPAAGYCLVASASQTGRSVMSVVLGSASNNARHTESMQLLDHGFSQLAGP